MTKILGLQRAGWLWVGTAIGVVVFGVVGTFILRPGSHDGSAGQTPSVDARPEQAGHIHLTDVTEASGVTFRRPFTTSSNAFTAWCGICPTRY